ncbi:helix-turn-helix domain-containing protein [Mycobacterium sp. TY815]|uniref:helix-turn-helix domain-containing protein n=1 Tax=Mycobacterium sp. TY815 TaxID=3050581 RepID=UPI0035320E93
MSLRHTVKSMAESHIDSLLTPSQVAKNWGISLRTVQRYIADGRLKAVKLPGGYYRVHPADARAALEASA